MVLVCSHTSPCLQMVSLTGELILPGQSFHQWTHLGDETSARLGLFPAHRDCIIKSLREVPSLKQLLHVKLQCWYLSHANCSNFVVSECQTALLLWWIAAAKAHFNAKVELHLQALFSLTTNSCWLHSLCSRCSSVKKTAGWKKAERRASVILAAEGLQEFENNWMQKSVTFFINIRTSECAQLTMYPKADVERF